MSISIQCQCGRAIRVRDELLGKRVRCPECQSALTVREKPQAATASRPPKRRRQRTSSRDLEPERASDLPPKRRSTHRSSVRNAGSSRKKVIGGGVAAQTATVLLISLSVLGFIAKMSRVIQHGAGQTTVPVVTTGVPSAQADLQPQPGLGGPVTSALTVGNPFDLSDIPLPEFPPLPLPTLLPGYPVQIYNVRLAAGHLPGGNMTMRVYMPVGAPSDRSVTCILVAPAGSNLLTGRQLHQTSYHDEALPYAVMGHVVITYSLDGGRDLETDNEMLFAERLQSGYKEFITARAGLVNARNALEFALARLPEVDPQKIYSAGHSSAGTLSLLLAATQPKLAGSIAYAPASNLNIRLAALKSEPQVEVMLPGLHAYLTNYSPITHSSMMTRPLFLFHAADDSNVPISDSQALVRKLPSQETVEFQVVPAGDHYQSMIHQGIPAALVWLQQQN